MMSKLIACLMIFGCMAISNVYAAETAWEQYIQSPSSPHAEKVKLAEYSDTSVNVNERLEHDLDVLEYEVAAGDTESIKLAFRIHNQISQSASISEFLNAIIGRGIRSNPAGYLQAIKLYNMKPNYCIGASPTGDFFVDREVAVNNERLARIAALKKVLDPSLRTQRDQCIALLKAR